MRTLLLHLNIVGWHLSLTAATCHIITVCSNIVKRITHVCVQTKSKNKKISFRFLSTYAYGGAVLGGTAQSALSPMIIAAVALPI